jgi:hypothetical protein
LGDGQAGDPGDPVGGRGGFVELVHIDE